MAGREWFAGFHVVESALRDAPRRVRRLLVESGRRDKRTARLEALAAEAGVQVERVRRARLEAELPAGTRHQGVAALCEVAGPRAESELPGLVASAGGQPLLLALDGVTDPHNLGACLRSAEAAGVHAVIVPRDRSAGLTPVARKAASGAAERLPLVEVTNLARCLRGLQREGLWVVGAAGETDQTLFAADLGDRALVLVMGAEGRGLRRLTRETCDELVRIPMAGDVESLNVSVATGVCLFEIRRQRLARHGG